GKTLAVEPFEILKRLLTAGQDEYISAGGFFGVFEKRKGDKGLHRQSIEVGEICHVWQSDDADSEGAVRSGFAIAPTPSRRGTVCQGNSVFFVETEIGKMGHDANAGQAEAALHRRYARPQKGLIAAKLVDQETANPSTIFGFE